MPVRCTLELPPLKHGNLHAQNTLNSFSPGSTTETGTNDFGSS